MTQSQARAVFLDRDGVIVVPEFRDGRSFAPRRLEDFSFYPDAGEGVQALKQADLLVIVATNQPDVGAGRLAPETLEIMHDRVRNELGVDDIEVCCDTRERATERRKPGAGMLVSAARNWNIDLAASYVVGDRATDIEAGARVGCTTVFIDRGYTAEAAPVAQAATVSEFSEAVSWILRHAGAGRHQIEG